jgi:hypothetical protein
LFIDGKNKQNFDDEIIDDDLKHEKLLNVDDKINQIFDNDELKHDNLFNIDDDNNHYLLNVEMNNIENSNIEKNDLNTN